MAPNKGLRLLSVPRNRPTMAQLLPYLINGITLGFTVILVLFYCCYLSRRSRSARIKAAPEAGGCLAHYWSLALVSMILALLLNHPNALAKVQEELDFQAGKERLANESDMDKLVYLQAIVKDTTRLYAVSSLFARDFIEGCTISGYRIPAGTRLLVNIYKIHRDPRVWSNPTKFEPERFLNSHKDIDLKGQNFELIPFGAGRRICPGLNLGILMTQLLWANFLQAFEISTPTNLPVDMTATAGLTNSKATPLEVLFRQQDLSNVVATTTLGLLIFVFSLFWISRLKRENKAVAPEAGGAWPIIGHFHLLGGQQLPHVVLANMADKYGPIFTIKMGVHRTLVVSNWEMAKECFTTNDKAFANRPRNFAMDLLSYGGAMLGFSSYGNYWRQMRKISTVKLLSDYRLAMFKDVRQSEVQTFLKELYNLWKKSRSMDPNKKVLVEMKRWVGDITLNVILRIIVGKSVGYATTINETGEEWKQALKKFFHLSGKFVVADAVPFLRWFDIGGHEKAVKETAKKLDIVVKEWLKEHKEKKAKACGDNVKKEEEDFMDLMLDIFDDEAEAALNCDSDTMNKAQCMGLTLAASDTTSVTLTWALSLLVNNPHVLKKAQQELDIHVGRERAVRESDINNLVYLKAIVHETLRLYPAAPLSVPHESLEDCNVAGYHIPAGSRLLTNIWKMNRDPRVWLNPSEYQPERFLTRHKDLDVRGQKFQFIPFGSGRRICPGISFSLQVIHLTLAALLQGFDFATPTSKPVDMTESVGITNMKATPLEVIINPRLDSYLY